MKALIFPGQGSQYKGMAKTISERYAESKLIVEEADQILGYSLSQIMFEGDEDILRQTRYTQPAIFLHSYLVSKFIDSTSISMTAGHSLGEYTAVCYSGAMSFEDTLRIVAKRGELMQRAGETIPGSMAAIIGLPDQNLDKVISESSAFGIIQAANFNSPGQVVLSGEVNAIKKSIEIARANGAKLAKELVVSGAFHSPLMKSAERELEEELLRIEIKSARIPICMNVSAKPVTDANQIRENLVLQLTSPVLWHQSVQAMVQAGITEFLEAGPQKVLQGLVKRIDPNVKNSGIDTDEDIEKYIVANTVST